MRRSKGSFIEAETQLRNPKLKGIIFNSVGNEFDLSRAYIEE